MTDDSGNNTANNSLPPDIDYLDDEAKEEISGEPLPSAPKLVNFSKFRRQNKKQISEHWDIELPIGTNLMNLINKAVIVPMTTIQTPIIASYFLIPSAMAQVVPILLLYGKAGCGKSTLSEIASAIHETPMISANTTAVALRNRLNKQRWVDPDNCYWEKNTCLVFDNINRETLNNGYLYGMLLSGYDRDTDSIEISKGEGKNFVFKVFGTKVMSSVHPIWSFLGREELDRRLLIIKCKKFDEMSPEELEGSPFQASESLSHKLSLKANSLNFLGEQFNSFWADEFNLENYANIAQALEGIPLKCSDVQQIISVDLMATGIVTGVWENIAIAVDAVESYWDWLKTWKYGYSSSIEIVLKQLIERELRAIDETNEVWKANVPYEIATEKVRAEVNSAQARGMLDSIPTPQSINDTMLTLGWRLEPNAKGVIKWTKIE
jgi:energy-coupling factor transporter ATP-binding protein EcfA2